MSFRISPSKTQWVKFSKVDKVYIVGKDVACIGAGCHLLFVNLNTGEEKIMRANDHRVYGDGISCFAGHKTLRFFGFSEKVHHPSIFIMSYPEFKKVAILKTNSSDYVNVVFSEAELFMALGGYPTYTMHVWKWRVGEKLLSIDTNLVYGNQILRTNYVTPVLMTQCIPDTQFLFVWEFSMCGSKCVVVKEKATYRDFNCINNFSRTVWTTDGGLFVLDVKGHLYMLGQDNKLDKVITWENEGDKLAYLVWFQNGFLIHGSNGEMKHYNKSGKWSCDWTLSTHHKLKLLVSSGKDQLLAASDKDDVLILDNKTKEFRLLRSDESGITEICVIYPKGQYIATVAHSTKLSMWRMTTGELVDRVEVSAKKILKMNSNPYYPYFCVVYDSGLMEMYTGVDDKMRQLARFQLCRFPLHKIAYSEFGTIIVVANMDNGYFFVIKGLIGEQFKVLTSIKANAQIADFILVGTKPCLRLFMIFVTSNKFIAGNEIWRYCIVRREPPSLKKYELENPNRLYSRIYVSWKVKQRDRLFYAVPMDCKNLHEIETARGDTHARVVDRIKSNHMMKNIAYKWNIDHVISYAFDGLVMVKNNNFKEIKDVVMPHHRMDGGVKIAFSDPQGQNIVSLGRDGLLVCTKLTERKERQELSLSILNMMQNYMEMLERPTTGFNPTGIYEGKSWLEYEEHKRIEADRVRCESERNLIVRDLKKIRTEVSRLLTKNITGPENEKLDLQEFNLDSAKKEERIKTSKELCDLTKLHMQKLIAENERVAKLIKQNFWDTIDIQTRNLWAIFGNFDVQSYCMLPPDGEHDEKVRRLEEFRKLEEMLSKDDLFAPWLCKTKEEIQSHLTKSPVMTTDEKKHVSRKLNAMDFEELTEEEKEQLKQRYMKEMEQFTAFAGTSAHTFTETNKNHYPQFEQQTFNQHLFEILIGKEDQKRLREYFNTKFEDVFQNKIREMGNIIEKNARLRYILSELNYFSIEKMDIVLTDPEWKQDEHPEELIVVKNEEVGITPYISPSEQAILDAKAAEAERLRLLMLADDFKERALMKMMNGVLEIRWEDELRKDVPKPKCMLEKDPAEFNEDDLRAVRDYDEKVAFLASERERYKVILTNEYAKISAQIREGVRKFNEKLKELLLVKFQVETAVHHEILRANRLKKWDLHRKHVESEEDSIKTAMIENESKTETMHKSFGSLNSFISEIRSNLELFQNKDKFIDKSFKKDFQDASTAQMEILVKLYKKRPKINMRVITSSCVLNELANCIVYHTKSVLLNGEALEFLKLLEQMDKYVGIPNAVDANMYAMLCRQRRIKIENELRVRAHQLDLTEAENTSALTHKAVQRCKEMTQQLGNKLGALRKKLHRQCVNMEIQVVLREGYVEIPRTGQLVDFDDAIMISRNVVEDINKIIIETGLKKIRAMKNAMNFKNEILLMEWDHKRRKMEIADLKNELIEVGSVNLTKEIQTYLKSRARGESQEKGLSFDEEIESMKNIYVRMIEERKQYIKKIVDELAVLKVENRDIQKEISVINVDLNEYRMNINEKLLKEDAKITKLRMAAHMKRSKLITQIQENQQEIFVLQTELELLRLRTVPILEYKVEV